MEIIYCSSISITDSIEKMTIKAMTSSPSPSLLLMLSITNGSVVGYLVSNRFKANAAMLKDERQIFSCCGDLIAHVCPDDERIKIINIRQQHMFKKPCGEMISFLEIPVCGTCVTNLSLSKLHILVATSSCEIFVYDIFQGNCVSRQKFDCMKIKVIMKTKSLITNIPLTYTYFTKFVQLNHDSSFYAILLDDGRFCLLTLQGKHILKMPDDDSIICIALVEDMFLISKTDCSVEVYVIERSEEGQLSLALIPDMTLQHSSTVLQIHTSSWHPSLLLFVDASTACFLYSMVTQELIVMPNFPDGYKYMFWDKNKIHIFDGKHLSIKTYIYVPSNMRHGSRILEAGYLEVLDDNGSISQRPTDNIKHKSPKTEVPLKVDGTDVYSFSINKAFIRRSTLNAFDLVDEEMLLCEHLSCYQFKDAWNLSLILDKRKFYLAIANTALQVMDIDWALIVYRKLGDAGMVLALQELKASPVENSRLLSAHLALVNMDYDLAQDNFLYCAKINETIDMYTSLMQWDKAFTIAQKYGYKKNIQICYNYAHLLEKNLEYKQALSVYQECLSNITNENLLTKCKMGQTRMLLQLGEIALGIKYLNELDDPQLYASCGEILEQLNQPLEAAESYLKAGLLPKSASKFLDAGKAVKVLDFLDSLTCKAILRQVGRELEKQGILCKSAIVYSKAGDYENAIRLYILDGKIDLALNVIMKSNDLISAKKVAKYSLEHNRIDMAIHCYILVDDIDSALNTAIEFNEISSFLKLSEGRIGTTHADVLGYYLESKERYFEAFKYFTMALNVDKVIQVMEEHFNEDDVDQATTVVAKAADENLSKRYLQYLQMFTGTKSTNLSRIVEFYIETGKLIEAQKVALTLPRVEYSNTLNISCKILRVLVEHNEKVLENFLEIYNVMLTFHLIKHYASKRDDHLRIAWLLLRLVPNKLHCFPENQFQIVVSAMIECQRSGLKRSALKCAKFLLFDEKFEKSLKASKLEKKVRQIESLYSNKDLDREDEIPQLEGNLPICSVSGKSIKSQPLCICPNSGMIAIYDEYLTYLNGEHETGPNNSSIGFGFDPILNKRLEIRQIRKVNVNSAKISNFVFCCD